MANLTPSSHFDVCELLHTFPEHSIRLSTKCSVSISFLPIIGRLSGIRPRLIPTISKTWVHRGGGFRFAIEISLGDGSFEKGELKTFNKTLGTKLKELELWTQLGFKASLDLSTFKTSETLDSSKICIPLVHKHDPQSGKLSRHPGLNAIIANTTPPPGVPVATLEEVVFEFKISSKNRREKRNKIGTEQDENKIALQSKVSGDRLLFRPASPQISSGKHIHAEASLSAQANAFEEEMLDTPDSSDSPIGIITSKHLEITVDPTPRSSPSESLSGKRERCSNESLLEKFNLDAVTKLVEAAIQHMLCNRGTNVRSGVTVLKSQVGPKLAEISPALFSPGYLQAVSQRSGLISTIAGSLLNVRRMTNSPDLKFKIDRLRRARSSYYQYEQNPADNLTQARHRDIISAAKIDLWMITQKKLYNPMATRRLAVINLSNQSPECSQSELNEPLNEMSCVLPSASNTLLLDEVLEDENTDSGFDCLDEGTRELEDELLFENDDHNSLSEGTEDEKMLDNVLELPYLSPSALPKWCSTSYSRNTEDREAIFEEL